ncbi:Uncharacterised protein [Amycolatopsis camponoti]|uniref:Uncharacterized protein n=1 Tax=Amycolatopsis camponoti TaxID=2606593 RepID=A0A6I8M2X1_9PSEU|nr:Uncharacterised protein [Amycolatopsis camponoti]
MFLGVRALLASGRQFDGATELGCIAETSVLLVPGKGLGPHPVRLG